MGLRMVTFISRTVQLGGHKVCRVVQTCSSASSCTRCLHDCATQTPAGHGGRLCLSGHQAPPLQQPGCRLSGACRPRPRPPHRAAGGQTHRLRAVKARGAYLCPTCVLRASSQLSTMHTIAHRQAIQVCSSASMPPATPWAASPQLPARCCCQRSTTALRLRVRGSPAFTIKLPH